jgi:hypothetical protein
LLKEGINNLFIAPDPTTVDLTTLILSDFIGSNRAAVIVVVEPSDKNIRLGEYADEGFYSTRNFPVYDKWKNTDRVNAMASDQLTKMKQQRPSPDSPVFLLSWALSLQGMDNFWGKKSILKLADAANSSLWSRLMDATSAQLYPNIISINKIDSSLVAELSLAVLHIQCERLSEK